MHRLPFEQQLLIIVQTGALLGLSVRVWWTGLHRVYAYFFIYLFVELSQIALLSSLPFYSNVYRNAWLATESLIVCFYALVVLELYSIVLRDLGGIASVSRRYIKLVLAVAIVMSLAPLLVEKVPVTITEHFFIFERTVVFSLVLFVLLIAAFLVYYPVPLNRNVIVYSIGYVVYFLTKATALFINNLSYSWKRQVSTVLLGVSTASLVFWLFALHRRGENKTLVIGHHWSPEDEERVLAQLRAINSSLLRAARK
jgi:hypothetical protein